MNKIKNILSVIILLVTFILVILLFSEKLMGGTPKIFGYQALRISSASMQPNLNVGDIILSKDIEDVKSVKIDDVVTYKGLVGDYADKLITHSVIVAPYQKDNGYYLQTKGIANSSADPEINSNQLVGKMVCKLTILSTVYSIFITPWGIIIILGLLAILFINEVFSLKQIVKENNNNETIKIENSSEKSCDDEETNCKKNN